VHVAVAFPGSNDALLEASGCRIHRLRARGRFDPMVALRLVQLVLGLRAGLVQTWLTQMDILAGATATALRVPWILSERSSAEAYPPSLLHRMRALIGRRANACIANSEAGRRYWKRMGFDAARIHVVPNAMPLDAINAAPPVRRTAPGEALVVYVGRFSAEKNLPLLLDALADLMRRRPARAVLCGDGPMRAAISSRAAALGIAERVTFAGYVSNVWSWLKAADAMVTLSVFEGHPNAVLEGMACGVPLVVSDIAAHRAILDEASACFVGTDAEEVARALETVIAAGRPTERTRRARARVEELTIDHIVQRYEEVYRVWNLRTRERR
jgi:glycosyltransferase involved in cell wall biosynthesis